MEPSVITDGEVRQHGGCQEVVPFGFNGAVGDHRRRVSKAQDDMRRGILASMEPSVITDGEA